MLNFETGHVRYRDTKDAGRELSEKKGTNY